jgi:hypothetical protein
MDSETSETIENKLQQLEQEKLSVLPQLLYRHVLIAVPLDHAEDQAISVGLGLASVHRAATTILLIQSTEDTDTSMHWLDGIDRLHTLDEPALNAARKSNAVVKRIEDRVKQLLSGFPSSVIDAVNVRYVVRKGEMASVIAKFSQESSTDVIVISSTQGPRWMPVWPLTIRSVMQLVKQPVIVVGSDARSRLRE